MFSKKIFLVIFNVLVVDHCLLLPEGKWDERLVEYRILSLRKGIQKREIRDNIKREHEEYVLDFQAFGRNIMLKLRRNTKILPPNFVAYIHEGNTTIPIPNKSNSCLLLGKSDEMLASINSCDTEYISGFVFLDNSILEIIPLPEKLKQNSPYKGDDDFSEKVTHLIRKIPQATNTIKSNLQQNAKEETYTLEVAVFFDEFAYKAFAPYLSFNDENIKDMLLAYLNGVQALYHHPTLGTPLDIVLVRLDILKTQPESLMVFNGESNLLLNSFCSYQEKLNAENDDNSNRWDMGLYLSGLDFFTYDNKGYKDYGTMGLSTVGGVCYTKFSCVISEFGSTDVFGKPYPTAGFTSLYVLAHEIGHNLGMHHDGVKNDCPSDGFIMSASRGTGGETHWSKCSAEIMLKLDKKKCLQSTESKNHTKFTQIPGHLYNIKKQCEIFLSDKDAYASETQEDVCQNLKCKTPHRSGYYLAGPALDGTECDTQKHCYAGDCIKSTNIDSRIIRGEWSEWSNYGYCKSSCIIRSRGYQMKRRKCISLISIFTNANCHGTNVASTLCKDFKLCSERISVIDYASQKCSYFSRFLDELDTKGVGLQSSYESERPWMSCAIFCRKKDNTYYTPRIELNDMKNSPYFPDGTWCHRENGEDFYCINRQCLPESTKFLKLATREEHEDDFIQNAVPDDDLLKDLIPYFSLDRNGNPIGGNNGFGDREQNDKEWILDYMVFPKYGNFLRKRQK